MRDWEAYVCTHLSLPELEPHRETRIVRELAAQLEDFYRDALARGLDEASADEHARAQIADWARMASALTQADPSHGRPRFDRLTDRLDLSEGSRRPRGKLLMHVIGDARFAVRQLRKTPGFTAIAALTLALGVGATTAIFSVINGVLLRPLPVADPDALVRVHEVVPQYGRFGVAPATFLDWQTRTTSFERVAAYTTTSGTFTDLDMPDRLPGLAVSWDLLPLLGVAPALGSWFTPEQDTPGATPVLIISHTMWQQRFGGATDVVGRTVPVNGQPATIVGVMPADFYFPSREIQFWQPLALDPANASRGAHYLGVMARLKADVTPEQADAEVKHIAEQLGREYPANAADESAEVVRLLDQVVGSVRTALLTLFAAVGVVVLIACANVANLLLVRASVREKEIAVRTALGAGRGRLATQMLAESLVLSMLGGALGILLADLAIRPIQSLGAGSIPRVADVSMDGTVLLFALGASILTGLAFGMAPAWQATHASIATTLKNTGRTSTTSRGRWVRSALLVAEVALSIVLVAGAMLLVRSFDRLTDVDPGLDADRVLAFQVTLPSQAYPGGRRTAFYDELLARLGALPGATTAGMVQTLPIRGSYMLSFAVQGRPQSKPGQGPSAYYRVTSPDYFRSLGIPLHRGRFFGPEDTDTSQKVAIVDESFIARHFSDEDPIGRGIDIGNGTDGLYTIVGVVADVRYDGLGADPFPTMYVPYKQDMFGTMWMLVRTEGDPAALAAAARSAVRELDKNLPAYSMTPMATVLRDSVAGRRFSMLLLVVFAVVALVLSTVGLYGAVSYSVSQQTREIGLRMAMGASPANVLRLVLGNGMKFALAGVAIGIVAAVALSRFIATMLFGVTASDVVSYVLTAGIILVVAMAACYVPARRATRVDPLVALQAE